MAGRSFQAKLLYLLIGVLILLQTVTLAAIHFAGSHSLQRNLTLELRVGSRVFERILANRGRQLSDSVRVLAGDFGFREAIASRDRPTITSVLGNHGSRIDADAVFLVGLNGVVTADTVQKSLVGKKFPFPSLIATAEQMGEVSSIASLDGRPYQLVIVPVLAPRALAWVCMGFQIDENVLREFQRVTGLDISLSAGGDASRPLLISTLQPKLQPDLLRLFGRTRETADAEEISLKLGGAPYETLIERLRTGDRSRITTVIQRSLEEARRPYRTLELQIVVFSTLAVVLAIVVTMFFAQGVIRPLHRLAENAERIERGDYSAAVEIEQDDEIGQLATAFNRMRTGIAEREDQIIHQATHDGLTGLPNRTLFLDRLDHAIAAARRSGDSVGIIMMDLDRFKEINDTLGHQFGDQLLTEIGRRLTQSLRESDTVARLGGDEFGVSFNAREPDHAVDVARRIGASLDPAFILGGVSIDVDASMGIAIFPLHADDAGSLMKRADIAMYEAKKNHTAIALYEAGRDEHSVRRLSLLSELRQAIQRDELQLHYQPSIDMRTGRVAYAEALVRWNHPTHGRMNPDEFIPLAEQSGTIGALTKWVLRNATAECSEWMRRGMPLTVAVNLSVLDLFDSELPIYISGLLAEVGLPASNLVLEITESAIMRDPAHALKILRELKARGIRLSVDDFGTGYSSLAHLKRLPVDELKIDKSFVINLTSQSTDDAVIVRSTIELGHNMGLTVIAEGVETIESLDILKRLGCDMGQGYYMSPPLPADKFVRWIAESRWGIPTLKLEGV
ncbi:MAG: GGDEF domain-containing protein [Acidobacteria bacterium]|nr:MAG: GGDEF domain-containing protein [Acidobacteriota bacterium]